jgi:hypothetical protein
LEMSKFAPHRRSENNPRATSSTICQKCLGTGHFIYECKSTRPYVSRPSRTQQLENPKVLAKLREAGNPSVEVPHEFKKTTGTANQILEAKEKEREQAREQNEGKGKGGKRDKKRSRRSPPSSGSDSSGTDSDSSSSSDSSDASSSDSDSSDSSSSSISRARNRKRPRRRRSSSDGSR